MSFRSLFAKRLAPRKVESIRRRITPGFLALEDRVVPTISVINDVLTIVGNNWADTVVVSSSLRGGVGELTVTHSGQRSVRGGGTAAFTETQRFQVTPRGMPFSSIRAELLGGDDRFTNNSALPSVALGGNGNDTLIGGSNTDTFLGGAGNDFIDGNGGNDNLIGEDGNDTVLGGVGDDFIKGNAGNDTINGESGDDSLYGDDGNDVIRGGTGDDLIRGGANDDQLDGDSGADEIYGDSGNDFLNTGPGTTSEVVVPDKAFGGSGNDEVLGGAGRDKLEGGLGDDYLHGLGGDDSLAGDSGNDVLHGGNGDDYLSGGDGQDNLNGGWGQDTLSGDSGNDTLNGGDHNDQLFGGANDDELNGGSGDDKLYGDIGNDKLDGASGNDTLLGEEGNDQLVGGTGHDSLHGGDGTDVLTGGDGNDTLVGGRGGDTLSGQGDNDLLYGGWNPATEEEIEGDLGDLLQGGNGNDQLWGQRGSDTLFGDAGNDHLYGGTGTDTLFAGSGVNGLYGGDGVDFLNGGSGSDRFLQTEDEHKDSIFSYNATFDAILRFENLDTDDPLTRFDTADGKFNVYAGPGWAQYEIESLAPALAVLHEATGDPTLLRRDGDDIEFLRTGLDEWHVIDATTEPAFSDRAHGFNDDGTIGITSDMFWDQSPAARQFELIALIGRNWVSEEANPTINAFLSLSGWGTWSGGASLVPPGKKLSGNAQWIYNSNAQGSFVVNEGVGADGNFSPRADFGSNFSLHFQPALAATTGESLSIFDFYLEDKQAYMAQFIASL